MKVEQEEATQAVAKYREKLFNYKNELKEVIEVAKKQQPVPPHLGERDRVCPT